MYNPDQIDKEKETSETKRTDEGTTDNHTDHPDPFLLAGSMVKTG